MKKLSVDSLGRRARRQFSLEQKQHWVEKFQAEDISVLEFARKHQLTYSAFRKWTKKLGKKPGALLPVRVVRPVNPATSAAMEIHLGNGRRVQLVPGFDPTAVRQLISLLEETC